MEPGRCSANSLRLLQSLGLQLRTTLLGLAHSLFLVPQYLPSLGVQAPKRKRYSRISMCSSDLVSHPACNALNAVSVVTGGSEPGTSRAHGGHSCHRRAGLMLHAWMSPEEAAVYLVQGHGDRKVDRRGFRCHGHMDARPWKHCKRCRHNLRVGRDEAVAISRARPILLASCPLCSEGSRKQSGQLCLGGCLALCSASRCLD